MQLDGRNLTSEGKLLEIIPIISDDNGVPYMLPPVIWHVPNWLAGYQDSHPIPTPTTMWMGHVLDIPGSNSARNHRLTFQVRILEDSPSSGIQAATVDASAVNALVEAIKNGLRIGKKG